MESGFIKKEPGTWVWRETRADGVRVVVKLYRKRSWFAVLRMRLFEFRTQREYQRLQHLVRSGIPCTEPIEWSSGSSPEHGRYEALVTKEIPGAIELGSYLQQHPDTDLAPLFAIVKKMHESGFCHQTLYARNVVVQVDDASKPQYFVLDVPRSWVYPHSIVGSSMALYDFLDLVHDIERAGVVPDKTAMAAYSFGRHAQQWWSGHEATDSTTKVRRGIRDLTARVSWAGAWLISIISDILPFGMF